MEPDEGFGVTLSNPAGGSITAPATARGMILMMTQPPSRANPVDHGPECGQGGGCSGGTPFTFTVTRGRRQQRLARRLGGDGKRHQPGPLGSDFVAALPRAR